jgi:hypothetical protein
LLLIFALLTFSRRLFHFCVKTSAFFIISFHTHSTACMHACQRYECQIGNKMFFSV